MTRANPNVRGGMRRCTICWQWKEATAENFYKSTASPDGLQSRCIVCFRSYARGYYDRYQKGMRKHRSPEQIAKNREAALRFYYNHRDRLNAARRLPSTPNRRIYPDVKSRKTVNRQKRRATKRLLPKTFSQRDWDTALVYFEGRCAVCNHPQGLWHTIAQDHWIPVSLGGGYTADNIIPLCHGKGGCNNSKGKKHPETWLTERYGTRKAKQILKRIDDYFEWVKQRQN